MNIAMALALGSVAAWPLGPVRAQDELAQDRTDACGAILCFAAGGAGGSECAGYLARYFSIVGDNPEETANKRRDFLSRCPSGTESFNAAILQYGQTCEPPRLQARLNAEAAQLAAERAQCMSEETGEKDCATIRPQETRWQDLCGGWYSQESVWYSPPHLAERCESGAGSAQERRALERAADAGDFATGPARLGEGPARCTYVWEIAGTGVAAQ